MCSGFHFNLFDLLIHVYYPRWQETYIRGNELQLPDCAQFFMENLQKLSDADYVPTKVSMNVRLAYLLFPFLPYITM